MLGVGVCHNSRMSTSQQTTSVHRYYRASCERLGPPAVRYYRIVSQHEFLGSTRYVVEFITGAQASIEVVSPSALTGAEKISEEEWGTQLAVTEKAVAKRKAAAEAKADALRFGVRVELWRRHNKGSSVIVRATRTQWVALSGDRYLRLTGGGVGRVCGRIAVPDRAALEERCGGAERFDFVADGKRRAAAAGA